MPTATLSSDASVFDAVAASYEASLNEGLRLSGECAEHFAQRRIDWTARILRSERIANILDFGCGVGIAAPRLTATFSPTAQWGFDLSTLAIERAKHDWGSDSTRFTADDLELPVATFDLAYCNGVFHHIPPQQRPAALATIARSLRPGGWFALWENNPWNPGTRWIMSRIPFDRDAVTLSPPTARRMLRSAGYHVLRTDAWFLFPHSLRWLRPLESLVHRLPMGGQYLVLAQKPLGSVTGDDQQS